MPTDNGLWGPVRSSSPHSRRASVSRSCATRPIAHCVGRTCWRRSRAARRARSRCAERRCPASIAWNFPARRKSSAELLALRRDQLDLIYLGAPELATRDGKLLPDLARDGVRLVREDQPTALLSFFSMRDPVLGGNSREKIALRRAIQMAIDDKEWIRVFDAGFSSVRQQVVPPGVEGHVPGYVNPNNFDAGGGKRAARPVWLPQGGRRLPAEPRRFCAGRHRAYRHVVELAQERRILEADARPHRHSHQFEAVTPAERLKRMTHCRFGMASMDWGLDVPDGTNPMSMFYSKSIGSVNMSCYEDAVFDAAFEKALVMPPGPERLELFRTMQSRLDAYAPTRPRPISDTLLLKRDRVIGPFGTINDWLQIMTLSVDTSAQPVKSR